MSLPVSRTPTAQEQALAQPAQHLLSTSNVSLHAQGQEVQLSPALSQLLRQLFKQLAAGQGVTILPAEQELTTQEAADLLNVSLPFLIERLLGADRLPYRLVGRHRRIRLDDLLRFQRRDRAEREAIVAALTQGAQELGLD